MYSEKDTKVSEIFSHKSKVKISQNFVAFSEYMNFTKLSQDCNMAITFGAFSTIFSFPSGHHIGRHIGGKKLTYKIERKESFQRRKSGVWTLF